MHIIEESNTVPGLGYQYRPRGHASQLARVTAHPAALTWWLSLSTQERGVVVRAAWEAAGSPVTVEDTK